MHYFARLMYDVNMLDISLRGERPGTDAVRQPRMLRWGPTTVSETSAAYF